MGVKPQVPALERGLDILEYVAKGDETGYSQLVDALGLPPASAARLLKCLCQREYLKKDPATGEYRLGRAPAKLQPGTNRSEDLLTAGRPVVDQLCELTEQTAILFYWSGLAWECVAKATNEHSLTMQQVGEIRVDIFNYPWGVFAYRQLLKENRKLVLDFDQSTLEKASRDFERDGYAVTKGRRYNRYAVPIHTADSDLLGVLAMAVIHANQHFDETAITDMLIRGGKQIEEQARR